MDVELIGLIANLGVLSIAGILYAAYIKNLRSQLSLKDEQIGIAEKNTKLWKDKALDLERQTPQYVEQVLAKRIQIREDEISRLAKDEKEHVSEIGQKNAELDQLKTELETAHNFGRGISVYDSETRGFKQLSPGDLTLVDLGDVWVDSATLMVCDPWHFAMGREQEIEEYPVGKFMYRIPESGEVFYLDDENYEVLIDPLSDKAAAKDLVTMGHLERIDPPETLPADPDTYIKTARAKNYGQTKTCTFYNGTPFAGLIINTGADGMYRIKGETYKGEVRRIFFDL